MIAVPLALGVLVGALGLLVGPAMEPAEAQRGNHRVVDRYNRVARGANIDEWHKRLFSDDADTRLEAVDSLGKDGSEESVKPLLEATADEDARVRLKAIDFLGDIGSPLATPLLSQYLFRTDIDPVLKYRIVVALGRIKDPKAVPPLSDFAKKTDDGQLRCGALFALGEIGDASAESFVSGYAESSDPNEKRVAVDALAKIDAQKQVRENQQPTIIELEKLLAPPPRK